jgi:hypothetical protein
MPRSVHRRASSGGAYGTRSRTGPRPAAAAASARRGAAASRRARGGTVSARELACRPEPARDLRAATDGASRRATTRRRARGDRPVRHTRASTSVECGTRARVRSRLPSTRIDAHRRALTCIDAHWDRPHPAGQLRRSLASAQRSGRGIVVSSPASRACPNVGPGWPAGCERSRAPSDVQWELGAGSAFVGLGPVRRPWPAAVRGQPPASDRGRPRPPHPRDAGRRRRVAPLAAP